MEDQIIIFVPDNRSFRVKGSDLYNGYEGDRFDEFCENANYVVDSNNVLAESLLESFDFGLDDACYDIARIFYNNAVVDSVVDGLLQPLFDKAMPDLTLHFEASYVLGYEAAKKLLIPAILADRGGMGQFIWDFKLPDPKDSAEKRAYRNSLMFSMNIGIIDLMREAFISGLYTGAMRYDVLESVSRC